MERYFEEAKEYATFYQRCHGVSTIPRQPVSNMFHAHFHASKEKVEPILIEIYEETGVGITGYLKEVNDNQCFFEATIGDQYSMIPKEKLNKVFEKLDRKMKTVAETGAAINDLKH